MLMINLRCAPLLLASASVLVHVDLFALLEAEHHVLLLGDVVDLLVRQEVADSA